MSEMVFTKTLAEILLKGKDTPDFVSKSGKELKFDEIRVQRVTNKKCDILVSLCNKGISIVEFGPFPLENQMDEIKITKVKVRMAFALKAGSLG